MRQQNENAVSPVVGVMLMLVVVIIIAAVVSGFAGGLVKTTPVAPQLTLDVHIINSGYYPTSYFKATVTGVSAPIRTNDLKIITSWSKTVNPGQVVTGGATITPGVTNFNVSYVTEPNSYDGSTQSPTSPPSWQCVCPQGDGPGVGMNGTEVSNGTPYEGLGATGMSSIGTIGITNFTWFGNYNLEAGTVMFAQPFGAAPYTGSNFSVGYGLKTQYSYFYGTDTANGAVLSSASVDQMQAVLGPNWYVLRPGDVVNMKIIHIPSGKTIWQGSIPLEGSVS
ncbi:MAG: type IV pilin [Methanoregula sp.]|uniref:type IV pilin n=1 Tax=Methanoregula sp. TaxID=2052170 RepID=UPI003C4E0A9A